MQDMMECSSAISSLCLSLRKITSKETNPDQISNAQQFLQIPGECFARHMLPIYWCFYTGCVICRIKEINSPENLAVEYLGVICYGGDFRNY